jgi:hypothetical protein
MDGTRLLVENFQERPKIREKQLFEITRSVFRQENTIGSHLAPMGNNVGQSPVHSAEAVLPILQLPLERHLQNALENLLVT